MHRFLIKMNWLAVYLDNILSVNKSNPYVISFKKVYDLWSKNILKKASSWRKKLGTTEIEYVDDGDNSIINPTGAAPVKQDIEHII